MYGCGANKDKKIGYNRYQQRPLLVDIGSPLYKQYNVNRQGDNNIE
jgi:hypothetical protein